MFKIARFENFRQASVTQRNEEACSFSDKLASKTCTVCKNQETGEKNAPCSPSVWEKSSGMGVSNFDQTHRRSGCETART